MTRSIERRAKRQVLGKLDRLLERLNASNQTTACYDLIQSIAAARERMPMKLEAVFS